MTQPAVAVLGIRGESIHAPAVRKTRKSPLDAACRAAGAAKRRFMLELQKTAQSILFDHNPETPASKQHATCWCNRTAMGELVSVFRTIDGTSARLGGVTTCGLVWTCPPCAAKVARVRRKELVRAMVRHVKGNGGGAFLMTLTFPHERDEYPLAELMALFASALAKFKNSRTYKAIMGEKKKPGGTSGRIGQVKSTEVTHGPHGWHPHVHELIFARSGAFGAADERGVLSSADVFELTSAWVNALVKVGLCPNDKIDWAMKYSLDMRGGEHAEQYIAKFGRDEHWGASSEMTGHLAKIGRREVEGRKHRTPFQILADAKHDNAESWRLFREYAAGLKGRRQLTWSPGLKKTLGVNELTDEEIAADDSQKPEERLAGRFPKDELALIASRAALGEFIEWVVLTCGDPDPVQCQALVNDFLDMLRSRPPTARPTYLHSVKRRGEDGNWHSHRETAFGPGTPMYDKKL